MASDVITVNVHTFWRWETSDAHSTCCMCGVKASAVSNRQLRVWVRCNNDEPQSCLPVFCQRCGDLILAAKVE